MMATTMKRFRLRQDDPRFGMRAGDILLCTPYWLDPGSAFNPDGKLTVIKREHDGFDPGCNVYWSQVELVRDDRTQGATQEVQS